MLMANNQSSNGLKAIGRNLRFRIQVLKMISLSPFAMLFLILCNVFTNISLTLDGVNDTFMFTSYLSSI